MVDTALLAARQKARALQHAQVTRNGRRRDPERGRQVAHRDLSSRQPFDDAAPDRVGQGRKDYVQGTRRMLNHNVKYCAGNRGLSTVRTGIPAGPSPLAFYR